MVGTGWGRAEGGASVHCAGIGRKCLESRRRELGRSAAMRKEGRGARMDEHSNCNISA